jgi:ubiquinol-cytochrome c reductase iron-sulfur subunit
VDALKQIDGQLRDPDSGEAQQPAYATNAYRSIKPEYFVAVGICTHLGCSPTYLPDSFSEQVQGVKSGFFCPCHGSKFDMAGRVFQGVPAPLNLVVPKHMYLSDTKIIVGIDEEGEA